MTSMSSNLSTRNARIGEISSPPRLGTILRNGARAGSQIWLTSSAPGLLLPGATHDRITLMIRAKKNIFRNSAVTPMIDQSSRCSGSPVVPNISSRVRAIRIICTMIASTSEDMSSPPRLGIMRRSGLSSGWVARTMNWHSGL